MTLKGNNERRVRVIESNTDYEEMQAGHIIPGADPPKNEHARGGFGDRDGRNGFGTDSSDGVTALSMNEDSQDRRAHTDGLQTSTQIANSRTPVAAIEEDDDLDVAADDDLEDDLDDLDIDDVDIADEELEVDFDDDADLDDDLDLDEDLDEDEDL